jgi:hypothetical protein
MPSLITISPTDAKYRMVDKYIREVGLMEMRRTFVSESCLASDVAPLPSLLLDLPDPSLKYAIQFLHIETRQNRLHGSEEKR